MSDEEVSTMLAQLEPKLYRIAGSYLCNHADQQDAVQDCFYKVWLNRNRIEHPEYFGTWVTRIMINICLDILRKGTTISLSCVPDHMFCKDSMEKLIEYDALYTALSKTKEEDRRLIQLRYFEGYMMNEISTITQIPVGTVQSRVYRSLKKIRRYLSA